MAQWDNDAMSDLLEKINEDGLSDNIELQLEELNEKFAKLHADWLTKSKEEQDEQGEWYYWAQRKYYQIGEKYTKYLLNLEEKEMDMEPQKFEQGPWQIQYQAYQQMMRPIMELKQLHLVNDQDIGHIIDAIKQTMAEANKMHVNPAYCTNTIIALISEKMDELSKNIWEFQLGMEEPTLDMLMDFLAKRIQHLRNSEGASRAPSPQTPKGNKLCCYCNSTTHTIFKCPNFNGLKIEAKEHFILVKENRCINCLSKTHSVNECMGGRCGRCLVKHNSVVCRKNPNNH